MMPPSAASARARNSRISFGCPACWQRLPRELRAPFAVQKLKCIAWLREQQRLNHIESEYLTPPDRC
jgi:hypothetical protein